MGDTLRQMAWKDTRVEEERFRFIEQVRRGELSIAEICRSFGVSRKTGYKWLERYAEGGIGALSNRSRAPHEQALRVIPEVVEEVWPQAENGAIPLSRAQLSMLLEGIDWRAPRRTAPPQLAV